ncbi:MAG: DUF3786 domain-containing protein [Nitrospirae bacterium]|nr:DUF3786 domain-containing protein [Nitrospirota bacterium]
MFSPGEVKAWEILEKIEPSIVCRNALAEYDEKENHYIIRSLNSDVFISPGKRNIKSYSTEGKNLIKRYGYFFVHSCLWYLINSKNIPLTEKLIRPSDIKDGASFFRGSHLLPLSRLAEKYGEHKDAFLNDSKKFGATLQNFGDVSVRLFPMPRIPVTIILWLKDEEFPARADLLFDSSCEFHLPVEILWSIAMFSILILL